MEGLHLNLLERFIIGTLLTLLLVHQAGAQDLSLDRAIELAIETDDWLVVSEFTENAHRERAIASGQLPDPRLMLGMANLPTDTLNFDQEPMTQFRIGLSQVLPRGDTLSLMRRASTQQSEINPYLRADRSAAVTLEVSNRWLDAYFAEQSIVLINSDRELFEQLVDLTSTRYTTAAGLARQQDLVRAELELVRLDDRLSMLQQLRDNNKEALAEWLPYVSLSMPFPSELPQIESPAIELTSLSDATEFFAEHPRIKIHDKLIDLAETRVDLARQKFKPSYSIGASYGYRDDAPLGMDRADFLTFDLSFDLPLFTGSRQRPQLRASQYEASARQTERILIIRELFAMHRRTTAQLEVIESRISLFNDSLLIQLADLTEATLNAYTADEGDFEEVMRAYIIELNTKIELMQIEVNRLKAIAQLNYLMTATAP